MGAPPPESQDDPECRAILATRTELRNNEGTQRVASDALGEAFEEEALRVEDVGGKLFVGNRRGLHFAGCSERTRVLEELSAQLENRITIPETKVSSLEERVSSLTTSLDACKPLRNRLLARLNAIIGNRNRGRKEDHR